MNTHTHALLPVSSRTYAEIKKKLLAAGYTHAFLPHGKHHVIIDMHGLALIKNFRKSRLTQHKANGK